MRISLELKSDGVTAPFYVCPCVSRTVEGVEEFSKVRIDPHRNRLWPVVVAALASIPLLVVSVRFSLLAADYMKPMVELGVDFPVLAFMFFLSSAAWLAIGVVLITLWVAIARKTFKWRLVWSGIALVAAGLLPLSWVFSGALF